MFYYDSSIFVYNEYIVWMYLYFSTFLFCYFLSPIISRWPGAHRFEALRCRWQRWLFQILLLVVCVICVCFRNLFLYDLRADNRRSVCSLSQSVTATIFFCVVRSEGNPYPACGSWRSWCRDRSRWRWNCTQAAMPEHLSMGKHSLFAALFWLIQTHSIILSIECRRRRHCASCRRTHCRWLQLGISSWHSAHMIWINK